MDREITFIGDIDLYQVFARVLSKGPESSE